MAVLLALVVLVFVVLAPVVFVGAREFLAIHGVADLLVFLFASGRADVGLAYAIHDWADDEQDHRDAPYTDGDTFQNGA